MRTKKVENVARPFALVHNVFSRLGFEPVSSHDSTLYRLVFVDRISKRSYPYQIRTATRPNGQTKVMFSEAEFLTEEPIPLNIQFAVQSKLSDVVDYLNHPLKLKRKEVLNTMAPDELEIKKLGKQMKHMKTNSELEEVGLIPDPRQ